jgi:hypothetical protein
MKEDSLKEFQKLAETIKTAFDKMPELINSLTNELPEEEKKKVAGIMAEGFDLLDNNKLDFMTKMQKINDLNNKYGKGNAR